MEHSKYNELIPNETIDIFYSKIEKCIKEGISYDNYIKNILLLNFRIPDNISKLITDAKTT